MRILANDGITAKGKKMLETAGYTVCTEHFKQEDLAQRINEDNYEILLVRSATQVREDLIDACPGLKMIGRGGVGMDNIDVHYAEAAGIKVFNTPQSSSDSVAELVIGQMFAISRNLHELANRMKDEDFKKLKKEFSESSELRGKTLGIIGFGRIGRSLAGYALGIGMNVLAVDLEEANVPIKIKIADKEFTVDVKVVADMSEVLPKCDFVSVHMPLQENGDSVITSTELEMMKSDSIIINAARGGVINETDLIHAIHGGIISAAALDVFEDEPRVNPEILNFDRIFCTPHIGAGTIEAQERIGQEIAEIIIKHNGVLSYQPQ